MGLFIILALGIVIIGFIIGKPIALERRRKRLRAKHFPLNWKMLLDKRLPIYRRLPENLKTQLHGHTQVLLAEKQFIGCAGLVITEEIKVTIAAEASILLLNRKTHYYQDLTYILVYPSAFIVNREVSNAAGIHTIEREVLTGESWDTGKVIIAWDEVQYDIDNVNDGSNLIFHEFAHQLDHESGSTDGAPLLEKPSSYVTWARVLSREYQKLNEYRARGESTVMDYYGAKNPAEFFAVATETFFEKSQQMKSQHPELYEQLRNYYKVDPSEWS
jgi:hypothetical protein